ncbi:MAG: TolC family protein [Deltaproteobacteria bacterium]|nr:TolC family protein [Deltaproteobacteria bacterium]
MNGIVAFALVVAAAAPPEPLTLEGAMTWAREHAPAAGSAEAQAIIARARVDVARATRWPTVSGALGFGAGASNSHGLIGDEVCADPALGICSQSRAFADVDGSASVDVRWTVFDFGRRASSISAAELGADAAALDAQANSDQLAAAAAVAFLSASANEELHRARVEMVERRALSLKFAEERVRLGVAPPIEATRSRISFESARLDTATAAAAVDDAHASLARALGLDPGKRFTLAPYVERAVDDDPGRAAELAAANRPELRAQQKRIAASDADVDGARADFWPSLSASLGASARIAGYSSQSPSGAEGANAGLVLSVPIFDLTTGASVRAAEAAAAVGRAAERERALAVRADAAQAAIAVRAQQQALASVRLLVGEAEANLALAEGRYQEGAGSLLELVDAQTQQSSAQLALAQSRFQVAVAQTRLLAATASLGG